VLSACPTMLLPDGWVRANVGKARSSLTLITLLSALTAPILALGQESGPCANLAPPPGAKSLGYSHQVFCVAPTTSDISVNGSLNKLYSGMWYNTNPVSMSLYSMTGQVLTFANGGGLNTETRQSAPGMLPLLLGSAGFYVEFAERLSDNNSDHWPAVWLMPQEHDIHQHDHAASDPPGYERWIELDVDEGGFNTGHHGALINWYGKYPQYEKQNNGNDPPSTFGMDRTQEHVFGLSYDPVGKKVTWWVDGVSVGSASTDQLPSIVNGYHYYLLINNQSHKLNLPYKMYVRYFDAWSSGVAPKPPSGVRAETVP
jgi:hypothetical protein